MALNPLKEDAYESVMARLKMRNMRDTVLTVLNTVTLGVHVKRYFKRDMRYFQLDMSPPSQVLRASLSQIPEYRALTEALYIYEDGSSAHITEYSSIGDLASAENCLPGQGDPQLVNMGSMLQGRAPKKIKSLMVGAMVLPNISDTGYDSWIYRMYPDAIVEEVLWRVKDSIGDKSVQAHRQAASTARIYLYGDAPTVRILE